MSLIKELLDTYGQPGNEFVVRKHRKNDLPTLSKKGCGYFLQIGAPDAHGKYDCRLGHSEANEWPTHRLEFRADRVRLSLIVSACTVEGATPMALIKFIMIHGESVFRTVD